MLRNLIFAILTALPLAAQTKVSLEGLDAIAEKALADWKVPGVAIAIIQDDKVILAKGYGFRDAAKKLPVTPQTLFAIGSSTKSFTVAALASLVEEGKLDWDKPVRDYVPGFRMFDQIATDRMTPRDLVTHRSGLPRHDLMWYASPFTRKELFDRLRFLEPSKDFRSTFQYQNLMFMTAGYISGEVAGKSWEALVRERIFAPLGMRSSNFSVDDSQTSQDFALPYSKVKEDVKLIPFRNIDQIGPAGSINSNVQDMSNYVRMHLAAGKFEGRQVLSESNVTQMQTPQMVIPGELRYAEISHQSYGMGFFITTYRGRKLVHHGGNIDGFSALVTFMPREKIGMVILTNANGSPLPTVLSYAVYDRLLGLEPVDWTARLKIDEAKAKAAQEEAKKKGYTDRKPDTHPSHALKDYAGEYEHPGYGTISVKLESDHLTATLHSLSGSLNHFHYDVFQFAEDELNPLQKEKILFHSNMQGDVDSLSVPLESSLKEIFFTRATDRSMQQSAFLEPLAGKYALGPTVVTVTHRGNGLVLTLPGQPPYDLTGVSGTRFNIKGLTGYSVEFKKDGAGQVDELVFYQPNGTFSAKRQ